MHIKLTKYEAVELLKKALGLPDNHTLSFEVLQEQIFVAEFSAETMRSNMGSHKIAMIKALRSVTRLGLAEAKQAIESEKTIQLAEFPAATLETYKKGLPSDVLPFVTMRPKESAYGEVLDI